LRYRIATALTAALLAGCAPLPPQPPALPSPPPVPTAKQNCKPAPSEVVITDLAEGSGPPLGFRTAANVWYTGWLYDGCAPDLKGLQFESNVGKAPLGLSVGVGRVIKGWDEGVVGMKLKGKRLLIIPPNKAYGPNAAAGGKIPPNSTLVFEIEVMNIVYQPPSG
jgi:FKBP-type peptidyl-prolyl cis-trans isomerase FkpA